MRVVAFGRLDGDGRADPRPLAGVTVVAVPARDGDDYLVYNYAINHRRQHQTGAFAQQAADASPAVIGALTSGSDYHIFVTATNTQGTSSPSVTVTATALASAASHAAVYYTDLSIAPTLQSHIRALAEHGIFTGTDCGVGLFCPNRDIKRWEAAVWLARELNGDGDYGAEPPATTNRFADVSDGSMWSNHINWIAQENITSGCDPSPPARFCPDGPVSRAQMAVFLARAYSLPPAPSANFADVAAGHWAKTEIDRLYGARITLGCSTTAPPRFCPDDRVTRAQMATFIDRARNYTPPTTTPGQPSGPLAPAITKITPGPGAITIEWRHTTGTPRANGWVIKYVRLTPAPPPPEMIHETKTQPVAASGADTETYTLEGLEFGAHYRISIKGVASSPGTAVHGSYSTSQTVQTPPAAVRLVALEITQGLQNWNGDITLVRGKRTVVRAFLEPSSGSPTTVGVSLRVLDGDGDLLGTVHPNSTNTQGTGGGLADFTASKGAATNRNDLYSSVNFVLEDRRLVGEPGDVDLTRTYQLSVSPSVDCQEAIDPDIACGAEITLTGVAAPRVVVVPLIIAGTGTRAVPTAAMIVEHVRRLKSLMPVPEVEIVVHPRIKPTLPDSKPPDENEQQEAISGAIFDALEGVQDGYPGSVILGIAYELDSGWGYRSYNGAGLVGGTRAWWKMIATTALIGSDVYGRNTGSHEFGHVLGARHAAYDDGTGTFNVACSTSEQEGVTEAYPHLDPVATTADPADKATKALLGPAAGPDRAVWGLDTRVFDDTIALPAMLAVMDPGETFSIMSYCRNGSRSSDGRQDRWVDEHFHERFVMWLLERDWGPVLAGASAADDGAGARDPTGAGGSVRDVLVVSGSRTVAADGSVDVALSPTYTYATSFATSSLFEAQTSGDWVLELLDGAGAVMRSVRFAADTPVADIDPGSSAAVRLSSERWRVAVPDAPAYSSYRIRRGTHTVAVSAVSAAAPAVSVIAPVAGQMFSGASVSVSWTASDADGDDLVYHVHYSSDGGATYSTVGAGLKSTTLALPREQLAGSGRAVFRVVASDGTRSTTAQSAVFTVAENPPDVIVHSPDDGRILGGPGTVVLDATGIDAEDGVLADTALVWTSDLDGQIAATAAARIPTDTLSEGTHVLTVTATDSSAMTASASVTVTVRATNGAPTARPDIAYSRPGHIVTAGVLANDTDPESDIDPWSVRVVVPGALGAATADSPPLGAIAYDASTAGIDVVVYEACDRFLQCTTAELVVAVLEDR